MQKCFLHPPLRTARLMQRCTLTLRVADYIRQKCGIAKTMHRYRSGSWKIDQLIAKTVENGADLSSDRRNGANPTLDMNGDPVPDQYYNPITATARGDESAITVIASSHPEYFFFFFFFYSSSGETSADSLARPCVDGRWVKETAKRVVSDGNRGERGPSAVELSAGFGDRKDIAHVTVGAINSRYIPAIVDAFFAARACATTRATSFSPGVA